MTVIVDYKMGNLGSISNIIKKVGHSSTITSDPEAIKDAERIILPGVGAFDKAMQYLDQLHLIDILNKKALIDKIPVLGICLGMQLIGRKSEEGSVNGLGWIDADVVKFNFNNKDELKIPHMGWNEVTLHSKHPVFDEIEENPRYYFVHSYHAICDKVENELTNTSYGYKFASAIVKDNIIGVQFHPEKSHKFGMKLMKNFIEKC